jgi:5-methylcytosine-specific restriction endonuclease McrA
MARPNKEGLDYFPKWRIHNYTLLKFNSIDFKTRYKALRNASSGFIKRKDVRDIIFKRDNYKCVICGGNKNLTIDHIISVWQVAKDNFPISLLNTEKNLRTLCQKCNFSKTP